MRKLNLRLVHQTTQNPTSETWESFSSSPFSSPLTVKCNISCYVHLWIFPDSLPFFHLYFGPLILPCLGITSYLQIFPFMVSLTTNPSPSPPLPPSSSHKAFRSSQSPTYLPRITSNPSLASIPDSSLKDRPVVHRIQLPSHLYTGTLSSKTISNCSRAI